MKQKSFSLNYTQMIFLAFFALVLMGASLLSLPIATRTGNTTSFFGALFTATSAISITGLAIYDTYTHWSLFGQIVILCFIQIGGLGFMTILTIVFHALRRKMGLEERQLLMQTSGMKSLGGILPIVRRIAIISFVLQGIFAVFLAFRFVPQLGFSRGLYFSIFHAISAFCNAGFDLMGHFAPYSSLSFYANDMLINFTVIVAVIVGSFGFIVWNDIWNHKAKFPLFSLHSKIVLTATFFFIVLGFILFFLLERGWVNNGYTLGERILHTFFLSSITRTAGFHTIDTATLSTSSTLLSMIFMIIGGSSGSTAGGIKTTTIVVLLFHAINTMRRSHSLVLFRRKISDETIKNACAIFFIYLSVLVVASVLLTAIEPNLPIEHSIFEVISATGTVGLSLGITPYLSTGGKMLITLLMFAGRVGLLTLLVALVKKHPDPPLERPVEKILVG